jgi:hypothetical protein
LPHIAANIRRLATGIGTTEIELMNGLAMPLVEMVPVLQTAIGRSASDRERTRPHTDRFLG